MSFPVLPKKAWMESITELKRRGLSERQIAEHLDFTVSQLRIAIATAKKEIRILKKEN